MSNAWMGLDASDPKAVCATDGDARAAHQEAADTEDRGHLLVRLYEEARDWCLACPVRKECLDYALAIEFGPAINRAGVLGGKTPAERAALAGHARKTSPDHLRKQNRERRKMRRQAQTAALTIPCPSCKQPGGRRCVSTNGNATEPHLARVQAAEAVAA